METGRRRGLVARALPVALALLLRGPASAQSPPDQFRVTIVQGASAALAHALVAGKVARRHATPGGRSGPTWDSLRVTSGTPAHVESGRTLQAFDRIYLAHCAGLCLGAGLGRSEKRLANGFDVTATARGERVELSVEPFATREGAAAAGSGREQRLATTLWVRPGQWTIVGGGAAPEAEGGRSYSTRAPLDASLTLLRVDVIDAGS